MKKVFLLLALLLAFTSIGLGQGSGPITVKEVDGSPVCNNCRTFIFPNGSLTVSGNKVTVASGGGGGTGDVVGPGSATDNAVVRFNTTTGKLVQNSVVLIGDTGNVTGLGTLNTHTIPGGTDTFALLAASQSLLNKKLGSLTSNGLVTTSGGDGTLGVTVPGTGVLTALAVNVGSAGAFVTFNGAGGTPSSITLTNGSGLPPTTGISGWPANSAGVLTNNGSGTLSWGAGGSGITVGTTTVTSGTATRLLYETAGNVVGEISGATSDGTNLTTSSGALRATSPRITTSIFDANGLAIISLNPTASAVNSLQITNGATGSPGVVDLAAIGSDSDVRLTLTPKGVAGVRVTSGVTTGSGTTAGFQVAVDSLTTGAGASFASSSVTSGNVVSMASTSTAAASNTQTVLNVATSGANGTSTQTTYGAQFSNTHTGTSSTNIALQVSASGGTNNYAIKATGQIVGQTGFTVPAFTFADNTAAGFIYSGITQYQASASAYPIGFSTDGLRVGNTFSILFNTGGVSGGFDFGLTRAATGIRVSNGSTGAGSLVFGTSTVGSIGTSGVGVLAIANGTAPTSSPADTAQIYTADITGTAGSAGFHIRNEINTAGLILPGVRYKTDTGDPTDTYEGMMVINTFDNTFKVYAEGAWRTITTW